MKDNRSLLLLLLTAGLVITWVYHIYDKSRYSSQNQETVYKDSLALVQAVTDSLRKEFKLRLDSIDFAKENVNPENDSLQTGTMQNPEEINRLHTEIDSIFKRSTLTQADLDEANAKIKLLQQRTESLRGENLSLTEENKKLKTAVRLSAGETNTAGTNSGKIGAGQKPVSKINNTAGFTVSAVRFTVTGSNPEGREMETNQQETAQKFNCSFILQNNKTEIPGAEIFIVITDPSGKTVSTEVWDAGSFETISEGRKVFTRKLKFDYHKGEAKRIALTLTPDFFETGLYKLGIYFLGVRIGEGSWKLN
jgi:hypothetical protein